MRGLEGVRVPELGEMVSAAYAAKLFADLGADVVKVESPGGERARRRGPFPSGESDPERSGLFLYLNTNKRSVVLDLDEPLDPEPPGHAHRRVRHPDPQPAATAGRGAGGWATMSPGALEDPELPPLKEAAYSDYGIRLILGGWTPISRTA